jgi:hypothetical protein
MPTSSAATAPANCFEGGRGTATLGAGALGLDFPPDLAVFADFNGFADKEFAFFFVFMDLEATLVFALFLLLCFEDFGFFGIAGWATYNVYPAYKSSCAWFYTFRRLEIMSPGYSSPGGVRSFSTNTDSFWLAALEAGLNMDVLGSFDAKTNSIAADFQNGDLHLVGDDDLLVFFAANYEHRGVLLSVRRSDEQGQKYKRVMALSCNPSFNFY